MKAYIITTKEFLYYDTVCVGFTYDIDVVRWWIQNNPFEEDNVKDFIIEINYDNIVEFTKLLTDKYGLDELIDTWRLSMYTDKIGNQAPLYITADSNVRHWDTRLNKLSQDLFAICTNTALKSMKFMRDINMARQMSNIFLGNAEKFDFKNMDLGTFYVQTILSSRDWASDYYSQLICDGAPIDIISAALQ